MSVWRVENGAGERKGCVAGRLAAVLSIGADRDECNNDGSNNDGSKRQKRTFQYGKQYEGTVRDEPVPDTSVPSGLTKHYYVEMDSVDSMPEPNKFYFRNIRTHHAYRSPLPQTMYTFKATYENVEYRFIENMQSHSLAPAINPVFEPGTRVLFKPIPVEVLGLGIPQVFRTVF